ncbi:MAG: putative bifunctional diguanylate cyclase/phosphodiesterase [Myxococcota bacterium]
MRENKNIEAAKAPHLDDASRVIAELGSDWACVLSVEERGEWSREWVSGSIPVRPDLDLVSLSPEEIIALLSPEDQQLALDQLVRAMEFGSDRAEFRINLGHAGTRWVESALRIIRPSEPGQSLRIFSTMRDVTDRRETEEALRQSESQYRALIQQASDGIIVFDAEGRINTSNPAAHELFGLDRETLHQTPMSDLFLEDEPGTDQSALVDLDAGMTARSVRRLSRSRGENWIWTELSARRLNDGMVLATARNITKRMEAEQRIRHLAYFDSLTGLPNRDLFHDQIAKAIQRAGEIDKPMALLFLDIDRFKHVNDSLGHTSGDVLLTQVAQRLRSAVRGSDSIGRLANEAEAEERKAGGVSRLGGDEFTIVVTDLDHPQDAARVARRVLDAMSRPIAIGEQEIFTGCSIGIAVWPDDGDNSEELLRSADLAMYHAKGVGGQSYQFFDASMNHTSTRRLNLENKLRRALERDEFHLVYQPIRDGRTGRVSAAEALLRWTDSDGESIGPDEFVPLAEETGLIVDIGAWVLREACMQASAWQAAGYEPIRMSVNISVNQLRSAGIMTTVNDILCESELSAADLELEITETSILDANPNIVAAVEGLANLGIGFALDDFGTGYSSLSALQRFPIERLKIDRSFVSGLGRDASDEALCSAISALAKRLGLAVVAEGVETQDQVHFLVGMECQELQGYLFSRPLPADQFEPYLAKDQKRWAAVDEKKRLAREGKPR